MDPGATYITIDFECFQPNVWQSVGLIVVRNGECIDQLEVACERGLRTIPCETVRFWKKHQAAFDYNERLGAGQNAETQELKICKFIKKWKRVTPNFYMIVDTPEYDISILNEILVRNAYDVVSKRSEQLYLQSICTWSSRRILNMMRLSIENNEFINIHNNNIRHTPVTDCIRILNEYFNILECLTN
jgi:hypothetical protein